jgi:hypothetical protein
MASLCALPQMSKGIYLSGQVKWSNYTHHDSTPAAWTIDAAQNEARRLQVIIDKGDDPRQIKADALAQKQAELKAKQNELVEIEAQTLKDSITLGMAWPVYTAAKRDAKRKGGKIGWSEWHIRDHENVVSVGGEKKKRGKV